MIGVAYIFLFVPWSLKAAKQSVVIPAKTVNQVRRARRERNEKAFVLDYESGSPRPKRILIRKGTPNSIDPRAPSEAEILIHTHPAARDPDKVSAAYATELRERPSGSDIGHLVSSHRDQELVMTPSGKLIEYRKVESPQSPSRIPKIVRMPQNLKCMTTTYKLNKADKRIQKQVLSEQRITTERDARLAAREVNRQFIREAESTSNVDIREVKAKEPKFKTEVID